MKTIESESFGPPVHDLLRCSFGVEGRGCRLRPSAAATRLFAPEEDTMRMPTRRWLSAALLLAALGWFCTDAAAQDRRRPPDPRQEDPLAPFQGRWVMTRHVQPRGEVYHEETTWIEIRGDRFSTYK